MPPTKAHSYIQSERRRYQRAAAGKAWSIKDLPQFYYHTNFQNMLDDVSRHHTSVLGKAELKFLTKFRALPHGAQCAYVRLASRKGRVFDVTKLTYPEIDNLSAQFDRLHAENLISHVTARHFAAFLSSLTKPDLAILLSDHLCETEFKKSWKKERLVEIAVDQLDFEDVTIAQHYVVQRNTTPLNFIYFLYHGRIERNLQASTLQSLGLVKPAEPQSQRRVIYGDRAEAQAAYFYADALYRFKNEGVEDLSEVKHWPSPQCSRSERRREKLLQKLGGRAERRDDVEGALTFYEKTDSPHCNERVVRLRYKRGETDWVQSRLEAMIDNPSSDSEHAFAQDFYARKFNKKRTSVMTDILRDARVLKLDEAYRNQPERAALQYFKAKGIEAYRTENVPWKTLFGLLFWDELYPKGSSYTLPESLTSGAFYHRYRDQIEVKLRKLDTEPQFVFIQLLQTLTRQYGQSNGLIQWKGRSLDRIKALIFAAPRGALPRILRLMCENYTQMKDGYPDLMLIEAGKARLIEIKAQGDVLRRNQLTRLQQLRAAGFQAEIIRVEWVIDPKQIYVVVDVETTGGRAGLHRVTEIGAVKMQGGVVIDKWQSLINPQRSIPPNITRLTGISEAMVANAPVFREIADSFASFMGDAIFAAHNVNFDYGFISAEYEMIDRRFRHPKICTCASMRKLYPGHKSYSLKNLCSAYQIDLNAHHRALCDAEAAAELLKLVNIKRLEDCI
ncbi:exonuclease domain-containing protein [Litorimonas sp. RW-G-Af-16]|uniref:exonuclease domain-containing protein n=1 Tax=Litorimonas sp. RW-G-Af-16 TaxID=3241168 RepID=UPI00390C6E3E